MSEHSAPDPPPAGEIGALREWIAGVRKKFLLPNDAHVPNDAGAYWHGYEACLADLERFILRHNGGGES